MAANYLFNIEPYKNYRDKGKTQTHAQKHATKYNKKA